MYALRRALPLAGVLAAAVSAHVVLENPKPFPFLDYGPTNPIAPDGSDYPCKKPRGSSLDWGMQATVMAIGEDQTLSFQGKAVHGGGSCQLALTKDRQPTKQSEWMVIHSIEGGCPARNQKGNLEGPNTDRYTFQIPAGIEPGDYVFSWTWNARIGGQPEFYQNCAPITVKAAKAKRQRAADRRAARARRAGFPALFLANMGAAAGGCTTEAALAKQVAIAYPDPGRSVERPEGDALFPQPCDGNPRAGPNGAAPPAAPSSPAAAPTTSVSTRAAPAVSSASATTTTTTAPPASSAPPVPAPSRGAHAGAPAGPAASCTHGQLACFDGGRTAWTCAGRTWAKVADAPAGMRCTFGVGNGENLVWKPV